MSTNRKIVQITAYTEHSTERLQRYGFFALCEDGTVYRFLRAHYYNRDTGQYESVEHWKRIKDIPED